MAGPVSMVSQRTRINKTLVKINSGLSRKLPAAGCFGRYCETPGADVRRRTVGVISNLIKLFALRAERGQHWRSAIQEVKVWSWEEISGCYKYGS